MVGCYIVPSDVVWGGTASLIFEVRVVLSLAGRGVFQFAITCIKEGEGERKLSIY